MVNYQCERCHKIFNHYGNYKNHLRRKNPCFIGLDIQKPEENEIIPIPEPEVEEKVEEISVFEEIENMCPYCGKLFSRKDSLQRHKQKHCKKKPKDNPTIINNYQTINNFQQNIQQNINQFNPNFSNINPFGQEDVSFLTSEVLKNIIKNPEAGIPQLISLIHFNPDIPQNQNVRLKNKKEPYIDVFNGQIWEMRDKDDTINDLIASKKEIADDYFENTLEMQDEQKKKIINSLVQSKYESYTDAIDNYVDSIAIQDDTVKNTIKKKYLRLYDKLYKQVNLILLNNTQLAKNFLMKKD